MKWIAIALLVANLGLAAYVFMRERMPDPDAQIVKQQMNADQIRIIAPPAPKPATPAPVTAVPAAEACTEWGGFGAADLAKAQAELDGLGLGGHMQRVEVNIPSSYWVYIPPLKSKAEMDKKMAELRERGVSEFAAVTEAGRWRYAVSLGLFRNEAGARKFLAAIRDKGVRSAQLGQRTQSITQTTFLIRNPSEQQSAQLAALKAGYPGTDVRPVECPAS
ncbi:MAG TPA: SPOR domain-containing protein [Burkholderiales bacterium]|nr:SPOR domain-containing protein [Burkholderiales bacterium]